MPPWNERQRRSGRSKAANAGPGLDENGHPRPELRTGATRMWPRGHSPPGPGANAELHGGFFSDGTQLAKRVCRERGGDCDAEYSHAHAGRAG